MGSFVGDLAAAKTRCAAPAPLAPKAPLNITPAQRGRRPLLLGRGTRNLRLVGGAKSRAACRARADYRGGEVAQTAEPAPAAAATAAAEASARLLSMALSQLRPVTCFAAQVDRRVVDALRRLPFGVLGPPHAPTHLVLPRNRSATERKSSKRSSTDGSRLHATAHLGNGLAWLYRTTPVSTWVNTTFSSFSQNCPSQSTLLAPPGVSRAAPRPLAARGVVRTASCRWCWTASRRRRRSPPVVCGR